MSLNISVLAEILKNVGVAIFYVMPDRSVNCEKIKTEKDVIVLSTDTGDVIINLCQNLLLIDNDSVIFDQIDGKIIFRVPIEPDLNSGSFKTEVIFHRDQLKFSSTDKFNFENQILKINCKKCSKTLTENITFNRILPLPNSDSNDFFCHNHNSEMNLCTPKLNDFLYGLGYFRINKNHILDNVSVEIKKRINCKSCKNPLGINSDCFVDWWFSSVNFSDDDLNLNEMEIFSNILRCCENSVFLINGGKLIFQCFDDVENVHYLLLWVIDKNMKILINEINSEELENIYVRKIMYRFDKQDNEIVKQWLKNDNGLIQTLTLSYNFVNEIVKYLEKWSEKLPETYRYANGMIISYIENK